MLRALHVKLKKAICFLLLSELFVSQAWLDFQEEITTCSEIHQPDLNSPRATGNDVKH